MGGEERDERPRPHHKLHHNQTGQLAERWRRGEGRKERGSSSLTSAMFLKDEMRRGHVCVWGVPVALSPLDVQG